MGAHPEKSGRTLATSRFLSGMRAHYHRAPGLGQVDPVIAVFDPGFINDPSGPNLTGTYTLRTMQGIQYRETAMAPTLIPV
jgi:hypothetical protein